MRPIAQRKEEKEVKEKEGGGEVGRGRDHHPLVHQNQGEKCSQQYQYCWMA